MSGAAFLIFSGLLEELCGLVSYSTIGEHLILNPGHQGQGAICTKNHMTTCIHVDFKYCSYFSFYGLVPFCPLFLFDKSCNMFCVRCI